MKPRGECLYYLVREMGLLGTRAEDVYFNDALEHIKADGTSGMRNIELVAIIRAAKERGRLEELDKAVGGTRKEGERGG